MKRIHLQVNNHRCLCKAFRACLFLIALCALTVSCKNRVEDKTESPIKSLKDYHLISYEMPDFGLLYSKVLLDSVCTDEKYRVWTEQRCYPQNVISIKYFVENLTDTWWMFGRGWTLQIWDGDKWCSPKQKRDFTGLMMVL